MTSRRVKSYCVGREVVEHDSDVFGEVLDRRARVGHAGRHDKRVEDLLLPAALKVQQCVL